MTRTSAAQETDTSRAVHKELVEQTRLAPLPAEADRFEALSPGRELAPVEVPTRDTGGSLNGWDHTPEAALPSLIAEFEAEPELVGQSTAFAPTEPEPQPDRLAPPPAVTQPAPPAESALPPEPAAGSSRISLLLCLLTLIGAGVAGSRLAEQHDLWSLPDTATRAGALVATWGAVVLLTRRCGGRTIILAVFSALVLGLVGGFPEQWALAGAGVTGASVFGVLGVMLTRPARGLRSLGELILSVLIGLVGAVVVTGYDVELRPYRFRVMVLGLALVGAFALAWRLGHGARSLGRRGTVVLISGVVVLAASLAYVQLIRTYGSPGVVQSLDDLQAWVTDLLGATPRPIEAIVGFPALVWGVAARHRRRQGWWMCAFGVLGAAGLTSSLIQPGTPLDDAMKATGYNVLIGAVLGLLLILLDRLLTGGGGRRAQSASDVDPERPEPKRFAPLL